MIRITKDTSVREIKELGKNCDMCGNCCIHGAGFLIEEDIPKIAKLLNVSEKELKEKYLEETEMFNTKAWKPKTKKNGKPFGPCMFYDKKEGCKIHIAKPFQCKIMNCNPYAEQMIQWFYLKYLVNPDDPESIRQWASYLKHREWVIEGGNLSDLVPDRKKLKKILSYGVLK
jgi:Fe-S-cluster containining protein